jgi:hypothetical protein
LHTAETEQELKQLPKLLEMFQNKAKKTPNKVFDPDVVTVDIKRWQFAKRQNKPAPFSRMQWTGCCRMRNIANLLTR